MTQDRRTMPRRALMEALQQNWLAETKGARTYRALADQERDATRKEILLEMAKEGLITYVVGIGFGHPY